MERTDKEDEMNPFSIAILVFCGVVVIWDHFREERREGVVVTEDEIVRTLKNGKQESVRWEDLVEVGIITTDEGPLVDDVFWVLIGKELKSGCAPSQGAQGADELLAALQDRLPGFNNEAVIQAMGSTDNDRFVCWTKEAET
jgi:hypothetical protein